MPREGRGRRRGRYLADLGDAEGQTAARPRRLSLGLRTWAAEPMAMDHPSSSSGAVAPGTMVRRRHDRLHAQPGAVAARQINPTPIAQQPRSFTPAVEGVTGHGGA